MSIYDKAGVALIPSGTKAGTLYSVLPANGDGDFTHDRNLTTATRVNKDGLIESVATNVPRLDYPLIDGVVQDCPALLLEPSRTNRSQDSEAFQNWGGGSTLVTANDSVSPDGAVTADELTKTSSFSGISRSNVFPSSGVDVVFSVFVKEGTTDNITLRVAGSSNDVRRYFNITNETSGNSGGNQTGFVSEKIEKYPNGWYRVSIICTTDSTTVTTNIYGGRAGNTTFDGEVYIWGSQIEEGDYITSYIPNISGTTSTRSADVCNGSGTSAEFNDSEGVLFGELEWFETSTNIYLSLSDGTNSNRILIYSAGESEIRGLIQDGGSTQASFLVSANSREFSKVAIKYKENDFAIWINGVELATDSSGTTPSGLDTLAFNAGATASFYGKTKQVMTFKTALNDSELETLTSWDSFNAMATGQLYTIE